MKRLYLKFAILLIAITLPIHLTRAQGSTTSAMSGLVTDKSGSGLPGATVIALHTPTNTQYAATTNTEGRYNIQNMRVGGPYTVRTTYVGYQDQTREDINLNLGQNLKLDFTIVESTIGLGEVVVTGTRNSVINADRTGAATSISRQQIQTLPTLSRSISDFTRLTPQANGNAFAGRSSSFNNISIDGALFNNAFGLSGTLGGQTAANPISLDAIDQIQVQIAPYDVRQGSFTGAGINAVTRSGTNEFSGSVYTFFRSPGLVGRNVGDQRLPRQEFDLRQSGVRVGGPIIKNKVFFFVNYEQERRNDPATTFIAKRGTETGSNVSAVSANDLQQLSTFLDQKFKYKTGAFEGYDYETASDKVTAKIDWNINAKNNFSLKYNFLDSFRDQPVSNSGAPSGGRQAGANSLPFENSGYIINNNFNSFIGELNSKISENYSNNLIIGYTGLRDFRESLGGLFPLVDIESNGLGYTAFGYEPFTANNILNSDIYQLSDNLNISLGKHIFTLGTSNEAYHFKNGFAPNYYGRYRYRSLQDFYDDVNTGTPRASQYQVQYAANPAGNFPFANINAVQLGFYAQDEFSARENLKLTFGIRTDIPIITSDLPRNEPLENLTFRDGEKVDVSRFQKTTPLWSPRLGFNWDVNNDQKTQLRGGTGIFTGRVPYVWVSNQASNNGILFGSSFLSATGTSFITVPFSPNVNPVPGQPDSNPNLPATRTASNSYNIAVTAHDFKFPQVFRSNLALDQTLPFGIIATLEGIYTKDLNAVYHKNINLPNPSFTPNGADKRSIFFVPTVNPTTGGAYLPGCEPDLRRYYPEQQHAAKPEYFGCYLMDNTNKGYSYAITAQLQKQFENGLNAMLAYTYSDARSVNDGGSIAQSIWRDRLVSGDPNANELSYSNFLQRHRIVGSVAYRKEFLTRLATSVAVFYEAGPNYRFSYTYAGDMNGDGQNNDLMYVPRDPSEIVFEDIRSGTDITYSKEAQSRDFFNYLKQDEYLKNRQGQYAERNGAESPWVSNIDFRLTQDVFQSFGGKKNTLQFTVDIFNLSNRLNSAWGVRESNNRTALLSFRRIETAAGPDQGKPVFQYPYQDATTKQVLSQTYRNSTGETSRWRAQIGIRYIFN